MILFVEIIEDERSDSASLGSYSVTSAEEGPGQLELERKVDESLFLRDLDNRYGAPSKGGCEKNAS